MCAQVIVDSQYIRECSFCRIFCYLLVTLTGINCCANFCNILMTPLRTVAIILWRCIFSASEKLGYICVCKTASAMSAKLGNSWDVGRVLPTDLVHFLSLHGSSLSYDHSTGDTAVVPLVQCRVTSSVVDAQRDVYARSSDVRRP